MKSLTGGNSKSSRSWIYRKETIGLIVGPLFFVVIILIPVPTSVAKVAIVPFVHSSRDLRLFRKGDFHVSLIAISNK